MENLHKMERLAPLEERIRDELLNWIKRSHFSEDQQLPSEPDLARDFGVSRATIRAALSLLAREGIIIRKHGSGTYVNRALLSLRLEIGDTWEFQEMIRRNGYEPAILFLDTDICKAGEVATALRINITDDVLRIRKIFKADGKPAIYSIDYLSLGLAKPPHDLEKLKGPIFPYLEEAYGESPAYSVTDIYPVIAGVERSILLQVEATSPLLLFIDVFFNSGNEPILYGQNYFTDLLHFRAIQQPYENRA
jgi:GntR family transcriptional regulator